MRDEKFAAVNRLRFLLRGSRWLPILDSRRPMPGIIEAAEIGNQIVTPAIVKQVIKLRHDGVVTHIPWIHKVDAQPQRRTAVADLAQVRPLAAVPDQWRLLAANGREIAHWPP